MTQLRYGAVAKNLNAIFHDGVVGGLTDGQLLKRFATRSGSGAERAFEALVGRYQRMVFGVCRRVLGDSHEAEDAFQATFLVLTRQARSLWVRDSLGPWLHRVAWRTATRLRSEMGRRPSTATDLELTVAAAAPTEPDDELKFLLHEEIARLPEKYRAPLVICHLEGRTCEQAAQHLRCPVGTVKVRLMRGRERLRRALSRRGVGPSVAAFGLMLSAEAANAAPHGLAAATARLALRVADGRVTTQATASLATGLRRGLARVRLNPVAACALGMAVALGGIGMTLAERGTFVPPRSGQSILASRDVGMSRRYVSIDIQSRGNRRLSDSLQGLPENDLGRVPRGAQTMAGVPFQIGEALIHLKGEPDGLERDLPAAVTDLPVHRRAKRLHVLHATQFGEDAEPLDEGTVVATLQVHYADGTTARKPVVYGRDVRDWWYYPDRPGHTDAAVAWTGMNRSAHEMDQAIRLFAMTWDNPHPDRAIASLDIISAQTVCEPLVVALTFEAL